VVLTEVLYLLNFPITAQCAELDFVLKSVIEIVPSSTESLKKTKSLMKKYNYVYPFSSGKRIKYPDYPVNPV